MTEPLEKLSQALAERYRFDRELGQGGMATVHLAEDLKHRRRVAIKVFRPEIAAALGIERFLREIAIAAQLQHPHMHANGGDCTWPTRRSMCASALHPIGSSSGSGARPAAALA